MRPPNLASKIPSLISTPMMFFNFTFRYQPLFTFQLAFVPRTAADTPALTPLPRRSCKIWEELHAQRSQERSRKGDHQQKNAGCEAKHTYPARQIHSTTTRQGTIQYHWKQGWSQQRQQTHQTHTNHYQSQFGNFQSSPQNQLRRTH